MQCRGNKTLRRRDKRPSILEAAAQSTFPRCGILVSYTVLNLQILSPMHIGPIHIGPV